MPKSKKSKPKKAFKFVRNDRIGSASAEQDMDFLHSCYVDNGDLELAKSVSDSRVIVLGRTGTGKSALLIKLAEKLQDRAISISPESLALTYVSNSTILNFFSNLGVNLDPFFKLLWRHVFVVEILSRHIVKENGIKSTLMDRLLNLITGNTRRDKEMRQAIEYLNNWGQKFWVETEYRIKEITETLESRLDAETKSTIGIPGATLAASGRAGMDLTHEQKSELKSRAQQIVSEAQVKDLHNVLKLLDGVLEDRQKQYYILIDGLDENWVEERLRYKLIMALLVTARDFIGVSNAKVILALRRDLIERVFRLTRDSGFQEEKYESLYLPRVWSPKDLLEMFDKRVNALVSQRYTRQSVGYRDLLPRQIEHTEIDNFITRIATTPRDVIAFFNTCITVALDQPRLTANVLKEAVGKYSQSRLRALGDEWSADYPALLDFAKILKGKSDSFKIATIKESDIEELCLSICAENPAGQCILRQNAMSVVECTKSVQEFIYFLMRLFYKVGLIGLKLQPHEKTSWANELGRSISAAEISPETSVVAHPKYHRSLGIKK